MSVDINKIKSKLLVQYPIFGSITANLNYVETMDCVDDYGNPTAGTDAETIFYHPDFINNLSESEQVFVFAHEVCHVALNHIYRSEGKDKETWNKATDAVINAFLKNDGLTLVDNVVEISDALNYDSEELYQRLLEKRENKNDENSLSKNRNSTPEKGNNCVGHDSHSMWDKAIEKQKQKNQPDDNNLKEKGEPKQQSSNRSFLDKVFRKNQRKEDSKENGQVSLQDEREKKIKEQVQKVAELGEKKVFKQNKVERKKQLEELRNALAKQSVGVGISTNSSVRNIDEIGVADSFVDWTTLLSKTVKGLEDWSFQNASIEYGVVTPHLEEIESSETEILLDTSGSISEVLLRNFLRECKNILQNSKMKVGCFDTVFYGFYEVRDNSDIDNIPLVGGGGTDFTVAVNSFTKADNKIIFTDGYASMPTQYLNAIWIVFGNHKISPPGGRVIYIGKEQLSKLCNFVYKEVQDFGKRK